MALAGGLTRLQILAWTAGAVAASSSRVAAITQTTPLDQLPPQEQLPAAPLLIAAYSVAWIVVAGYLFSIWRRMGRVEQELAEVSRRLQQRRS